MPKLRLPRKCEVATSRSCKSQRGADPGPGRNGKLKESFNQDRAAWETEKASLTKRAVDAEEALKPVAEELAGLKRQINAMTSAIFGKYLLMYVASVNES